MEHRKAKVERFDVAIIIVGFVVLALSWMAASGGKVSGLEESVFRFFNDWPDWLKNPTWPIMQAGALAAVPVIAALLYFFKHRWAALAVVVAGLTTWLLAKVVKDIVGRGRPQQYLDNVHLRPAWDGLGFISGHAALAFAVAAIVATVLPRRWDIVMWCVAVATAVLRMYTAAHLPLDVIGGAGLGLMIGGVARILLGRYVEPHIP